MLNVRWSDGPSLLLLQNAKEHSLEARGFVDMLNVRWSDGPSLLLLQNAREHSLEARGFATMPNVRWSDGSIGSIGQAILRSAKYFTDGEMT